MVLKMLDDYKAKKSRQEMIDNIMCKPGYTYSETLKRCLPGYVGPRSGKKGKNPGKNTENPAESAEIAIAKEGAARKSANKQTPKPKIAQ